MSAEEWSQLTDEQKIEYLNKQEEPKLCILDEAGDCQACQ